MSVSQEFSEVLGSKRKVSGREPRVGVGAVLVHKDKVLMCRRKSVVDGYDSKLHFFGGKVELGESMRSALAREIMEELGIDVFSQSLAPLNTGLIEEISANFKFRCDQSGDEYQYHWVSSVWLVHVDSEVFENREPHKHYDVGWYSIAEIANMHDELAPSAQLTLMQSGLVAPF